MSLEYRVRLLRNAGALGRSAFGPWQAVWVVVCAAFLSSVSAEAQMRAVSSDAGRIARDSDIEGPLRGKTGPTCDVVGPGQLFVATTNCLVTEAQLSWMGTLKPGFFFEFLAPLSGNIAGTIPQGGLVVILQAADGNVDAQISLRINEDEPFFSAPMSIVNGDTSVQRNVSPNNTPATSTRDVLYYKILNTGSNDLVFHNRFTPSTRGGGAKQGTEAFSGVLIDSIQDESIGEGAVYLSSDLTLTHQLENFFSIAVDPGSELTFSSPVSGDIGGVIPAEEFFWTYHAPKGDVNAGATLRINEDPPFYNPVDLPVDSGFFTTYFNPNPISIPRTKVGDVLNLTFPNLGSNSMEVVNRTPENLATQFITFFNIDLIPVEEVQCGGPDARLQGILRGDADLDGDIDDADVELIILISAGLETPTPGSASPFTADANQDGTVTIDDASVVISYVRSGGPIYTSTIELRAESGANQVTLFWDPVAHTNLEGYGVYRSLDGGQTLCRIGTTAETTFTDTDIVSREYLYTIRTLDTLGNDGPDSDTKSVLGNTIRVAIPEVWAPRGFEVRVPLNLGNVRGITPEAVVFKLRYDTSIAGYVRTEATILSEEMPFLATDRGEGLIAIIGLPDESASIVSGEGRVFDIFLKVKDTASLGCFDLTMEEAIMVDGAGQPISTVLVSGKLCVGDDAVLGDVDGNGIVNDADADEMLKISVKSVEPDARQKTVGDINGDGTLDSADAVLITRLANEESVNPDQKSSKSRKQFSAGGTRQFTLPNSDAAKDETLRLPVTLSSAAGVSGADLIFTWPSADFEFMGATPTGVMKGFDISVNSDLGLARVSLSNATALQSTTESQIVELQFRTTGELTMETSSAVTSVPPSTIRFNEARLKGSFGESFLWFGDIARANATITIVDEIAVEGEGDGAGESEGQGENEGEGEGEKAGCAGGGAAGDARSPFSGDSLAALLVVALLRHRRPRRKASRGLT